MEMLNSCHYNVKLIVIIALVATIYYPSFITAAVIRSEFDEELQQKILHAPKSIRISRATTNSNEEDTHMPTRYCYNMACGWAVYHPFTRSIEYFMKNTCVCPDKSFKCVRFSEDLSASAYVYRCRQNTTADNIEFPEDAN